MTSTPNTPTNRRRGPVDLIRRHPLIAFFTLALGLSWAAWTPYVLSENGIGVWDFAFPVLLGTSQFTGMLFGAYLGPLGAAFLVTAIVGGRAGLRTWVGRLLRWRVAPRFYLLALLGVPLAVLTLGVLFSGGAVQAPGALALASLVPGLILQLLTTGLAEEPGWRDFALAPLQDRFGPLGAAAVLGPLWGVWHLPLFLTEWGGFPEVEWYRVVEFLAFCIAFNVVVAWLFNRSGQSLPVVMLFHVSLNNTVSMLWATMFPTVDANTAQLALLIGAAVAATAVIVGTRGRLGLPVAPRTVPLAVVGTPVGSRP
jgi:membrane protease YdiL (CAAX protease family)